MKNKIRYLKLNKYKSKDKLNLHNLNQWFHIKEYWEINNQINKHLHLSLRGKIMLIEIYRIKTILHQLGNRNILQLFKDHFKLTNMHKKALKQM